ncbi:Uncharacterized protein TCM_008269 [Theobroma cacao]|uniref:Uncharacterized protein n=1 Tax=Theobroma cacao TaxID=3641 RepID=A0A061E4M0_THECC|nr:Uncharacterized protein TCM_008269 [Theobroma cacao]
MKDKDGGTKGFRVHCLRGGYGGWMRKSVVLRVLFICQGKGSGFCWMELLGRKNEGGGLRVMGYQLLGFIA